jgi:hypothetical protein
MLQPRSLSAFTALILTACATSLSPLPDSWKTVPETTPIRSVDYADSVSTSASPRAPVPKGEVNIEKTVSGERLVRGDNPLTPFFPAIDSFDVSLDRGEVAFSAKRGESFDIGLVSLEGSEIKWVPGDPADEVHVKWAPRGHKISYFIRGKRADFVRTLHVPTSFEFTLDFPNAHLHDLAWDAPAERFAVALESTDASDRVDVMRYNGEERRTAIQPSVRLDVSIEPLGDGLILRPANLRYNEKLPLVIWYTSGNLNRWDDARGALLRTSRVACVVTNRTSAGFWSDAARLPWIDMTRVYVVDAGESAGAPQRSFVIAGDPSLPAGFYRRQQRNIAVRPADVKSFAASFIADQLKETDVTRHR